MSGREPNLDLETVGTQLTDYEAELREYVNQGASLADDYRAALLSEHEDSSRDEVRTAVEGAFSNALPTDEFDTLAGLVDTFEPARDWGSHEASGRWVSDAIEGVPTIAVDGSELPPTEELNVPIAVTQVAYYVNHHTLDRDYERGQTTNVLPPDTLVRTPASGSYSYVDPDQAKHARYEAEARQVVELIKEYADVTPPPVVLYDGSLNVSYTNLFDDDVTERYVTAMGRILAASRTHNVPVVGYIAGSRASDVADLVRDLNPGSLAGDPLPLDATVFRPLLETWGSRTALFLNQRDRSLDELRISYRGQEFDFSDRLLFTYADFGESDLLERLEVPQWMSGAAAPEGWRSECNNMFEYAYRTVLAEAAIGQGYPDALQEVDANAVLGSSDRKRLLQLIQEVCQQADIDIRWNPKDSSKQRRRG